MTSPVTSFKTTTFSPRINISDWSTLYQKAKQIILSRDSNDTYLLITSLRGLVMEPRLLLLKAIERCFLVVYEVYVLFIMSIIYVVQGGSNF